MEGWKFKILTWQETNRRWDGPIANSFRVERTPCSLLPPPIHWTSSPPPPLSATSVVFSLLFFFVSLFLSLPLLVRSPFPLLHPTVGWSVGAVLVFKDLITDSSLILSCGTPSRHLLVSIFFFFFFFSIFSSFSTFFLSNLASHGLSSSSSCFSSSSSSSLVFYWQRYAAIPLFHARETRPKRQGSVREEAQRW